MKNTKYLNLKRSLMSILILSLVFALSGCGNNIDNPKVYVMKSVSMASNGNWKDSLYYAKKALKLDQNDIQAQTMYAIALDQNGQQLEAAKYLQKTINQNPDNFLAQLTLGKILYEKKDYEAAFDKLANAHNLNPENLDALILYAQCSEKLLAQNTDELLEKLSKTDSYKNKPIIFNELGVYYARVNNLKKAVRNFTKAYKKTPNDPIIVFNLAVLCDKYLKQPSKAKYFYRKFISLTSSNPAYNKQRENVTNRLKII